MSTGPINYDSMDIEKLQDALQHVNFAAGKQAEDTLSMIMDAVLKKGIMPKTALQLGDETMEAIYAQGYNLYNQGKYKEASHIFRLLMMLDFTTSKYTLGLAACLHRLGDFKDAANLYLLCAALEPANPLPHFHSADCYLQMNSPDLALFSVEMAISSAGDQPQYSIVKERCILMKKTLEEQIQKREEEFQKTKEEATKTADPGQDQ